MKNKPFAAEVMEEATASFEKRPALPPGKLATLYTNQIMAEELEERVVSEPDLTLDDWRNLAFILERRMDYCETQMALVNSLSGAAGEIEIDTYKHFEAERSLAEALFETIDQVMSSQARQIITVS